MPKISYQTTKGQTKKVKSMKVLHARHKKGHVAVYNKREGGRCFNGMRSMGKGSTICRKPKASAGRTRLDGQPDRRYKANRNTHIRFS